MSHGPHVAARSDSLLIKPPRWAEDDATHPTQVVDHRQGTPPQRPSHVGVTLTRRARAVLGSRSQTSHLKTHRSGGPRSSRKSVGSMVPYRSDASVSGCLSCSWARDARRRSHGKTEWRVTDSRVRRGCRVSATRPSELEKGACRDRSTRGGAHGRECVTQRTPERNKGVDLRRMRIEGLG